VSATRKVSLLEVIRLVQLIDNETTSKMISNISGIKENILDLYHQKLKKDSYKTFEPNKLDLIMDTLAISRKLNIVQIGANDGIRGDPVYRQNLRHGKKLLLIEPQKYFREALLKNYSSFKGELHIEHVAIGKTGENLEFHVLKQDYWEEYEQKCGKPPNGLFSLIKSQVALRVASTLGINYSDIDRYLTTLKVDIVPLQKLIKKYNFEDIDVLQIDAEGYDFQIINSLGDIKPKIINFESFNLTPEEWVDFTSFCEEKGYGFIQGIRDTLAIYGSNIKHQIYKLGEENKFRFPIKIKKNI
tara:strand:+ start:261 stop:1163 length:903 start_codon:yes stop_codon:yes gene_type:complete